MKEMFWNLPDYDVQSEEQTIQGARQASRSRKNFGTWTNNIPNKQDCMSGGGPREGKKITAEESLKR